MKHLLICVVSVLNHYHAAKPLANEKPTVVAKPALDVHLLDSTVSHLKVEDVSAEKVICVYPKPEK